MLTKIIVNAMVKSVAKDVIVMTMKSQNKESAVKEKLGVSIDDFMKMDYHDYQEMKMGN